MRKDVVRERMAPLLARVAVVLVGPKYPENVGAAARVAMNMGISRLVVVGDTPPDRERMLKMATHNAARLIDNLEHHQELGAALAPYSWVVGTTARQGRQRRAILEPRELSRELAPLLAANRVALVFGPEDRGLTNQDLDLCNQLTTIPTQDFSSLNLAQAVAILTYELATGLWAYLEGPEARKWTPKLATSIELEGMYTHVGELLQAIDFLPASEPGDDYWMRTVRQFLGRLGLRSKEVKNIRGFCRQFLRHADAGRKNAAVGLQGKGGKADASGRQGDQHGQ